MRVKWWVGLVTIALATPVGARADVQATRVPDLWDSGRVEGMPALARVPVVREPATIRAVDTYMPRRSEGSGAAGNRGNAPSGVYPPPRRIWLRRRRRK